MRSIRSASGMKTDGGTSPRVGWCQRASASTPTQWPPHKVLLRLVLEPAALPRDRGRRVGQQLLLQAGGGRARAVVHDIRLPVITRRDHRALGEVQHRVGVLAQGRQRETDRARDRDAPTLDDFVVRRAHGGKPLGRVAGPRRRRSGSNRRTWPVGDARAAPPTGSTRRNRSSADAQSWSTASTP